MAATTQMHRPIVKALMSVSKKFETAIGAVCSIGQTSSAAGCPRTKARQTGASSVSDSLRDWHDNSVRRQRDFQFDEQKPNFAPIPGHRKGGQSARAATNRQRIDGAETA
jgi:hypothetical protein